MSIIFFLLVFLAPLGVYLLNAYNARRPGGIAGGVEPAKKAKTVKPRRTNVASARQRAGRNCGRAWAHFCLSLVGSRDACRWCEAARIEPVPFPRPAAQEQQRPSPAADEIEDRDPTPMPPPPTPPTSAEAGERSEGVAPEAKAAPLDILAEVEKILDEGRKE
ncbi:MAG: hypothetical protein U0547_04695 [Dehalococcoidia bacterium]